MIRRKTNMCGYTGFHCNLAIKPLLLFFNSIFKLDDTTESLSIIATLNKDLESNNFGNIPKLIKGPGKKADILDLSNLLIDFKIGCLTLLDLFYLIDLLSTSSAGARFVNLSSKLNKFNSITKHKNYLSYTKYKIAILLLFKNPDIYHAIYLLPGILMPIVQPNPNIANLASIVPPNTIYTTTKTTKSRTLLDLKNFPGCLGPGVLFRSAKGLLPSFVCLILCL